MARTSITAQVIASTYYPVVPLTPGAADVIETATDDPTDRDTALVDGKTLIHAHNTDTVAHTITITGALDTYNRSGDITAYSIAAGKIARFGPFKTLGWGNAGRLQIDVSNALVRLSIETLP